MLRRDEIKLQWSLLFLRFGLGLFLILWSFDKIVRPDITVRVFSVFYFTEIGTTTAMLIGVLQLLVSLLFTFGLYKNVTYFFVLLMHTVSTAASYKQLLTPFGENHLFIASWPVLFAFIALFLMREHDCKFVLDRRKKIFS